MGSKLARVLVAMHSIPTTEQQNGMSKPMKDRAEIVYYIFLLIYQIKSTIHVWNHTSHIAHPMRNGGFSTLPGNRYHQTGGRRRRSRQHHGQRISRLDRIYIYIGYNSTLIVGVKKNHTKNHQAKFQNLHQIHRIHRKYFKIRYTTPP